MKPKKQSDKGTIKLKAKKRRRILAALKVWMESADKVDSDPLKIDSAPQWVEKAWFEVMKVNMPGKWSPTATEYDMEMLGAVVGRVHVVGKFFNGEISMGPEAKGEFDLLPKLDALQPQSSEKAARTKILAKDFQTRVKANNEAIPQLMTAALSSSHEDALGFQKGLLQGMDLDPDELAGGKTFERYTRTFLVLAKRWREFTDCRSVAEVHRKLCAEFGEKKIGSLKHFQERVAKKIGMRFGCAGRPATA